MQQDVSSDMDRLTQLQDAIEDLFTIASSTLSYLTTRPSFRPLHPDLPVTFRSPHADPLAVVEANKRELLADLIRKAKQVELLVGVLPAKEEDGGKGFEQRVGVLQGELEQANTAYEEAVQEAETLFQQVTLALDQLLARPPAASTESASSFEPTATKPAGVAEQAGSAGA